MNSTLSAPAVTELPAPANNVISIFTTRELFQMSLEMAEQLSKSTLIPKEFRGNAANCLIALEVAGRLGSSPFMIIQNIDVIHGRPSFRAKFLTALVNSCGRFEPLQFDIKETGPERTADLKIEYWTGPDSNRRKESKPLKYTYTPTTCVAWAISKRSGERVEGPPVSFDMAIEEGWVAKEGSKWQTPMRHLMIRYRAAAYFANIHCSDALFGMRTAEEEEDFGEMRVAKGREVTAEPAAGAAAPAKPGNPWKDGQPTASAVQAGQEIPRSQEEATMPPRDEMGATIREAVKAAGITFAKASEIFKGAGLLKADKFANGTDEEYFAITQRLDLLPKKDAASETPGPGNVAQESGTPSEAKTEAQRKEEALEKIDRMLNEGFDESITVRQFEVMLRKQGKLGQTGTLKSLKLEALEAIAATVGEIVNAASAEEGGAE